MMELDPYPPKPGRCPCLRCQKKFNSPDVTRIRICPKCKETEAFAEALTQWAHTFREGADFDNHSGALTLSHDINGTHDSGWTIKGEVHTDYYSWVNEFAATHPEYGRVAGDFESEVTADTAEGFAHFMKNHPPEAWDYADI